jgi:biotin operon repressor
MNMQTLSLTALTNIKNDLNGTPNGGKLKVSREKALEQVQKLAKQKGVSISKQYDDTGHRLPEPKVEAKAPKAKDAKPPKAPKPAKVVKEKGPVIRAVAEELLMQTVGKDDDGRPQGRSYGDILEEIHGKFEGAQTSVACLRWYAVRMREKGLKVPNRPRAKPGEAVVAAAE